MSYKEITTNFPVLKNITLFIIHYVGNLQAKMTALPPIPEFLFVAAAGAPHGTRAGTLPRTARVEDVKYIGDAGFYLNYLPADATEAEKYGVAVWFGRAKDVLREQEREADRQRADQSRRGANAGHDLLGIARNLKTYSDGTAFANPFEVRIGARAGLNNCPPRQYSCLRFCLEPHMFLILGRELRAESVMTTFREFVAVGRATVVTEGQGILTFFERREIEVRRTMENLVMIMQGYGHGDDAKWRSEAGADELKGVCLNHLETLREQFMMTAVKLWTLKVLAPPGMDPHKPTHPYYIEEGIEAEKKRREEKSKSDRAAELLKRRRQALTEDSPRGRGRRQEQGRGAGDWGAGGDGRRGGGRGRPAGGRQRRRERTREDAYDDGQDSQG